MKKLLSLLIVVVMVLSLSMFSLPSSAVLVTVDDVTHTHKTGDHNVDVNVPFFSGEVEYTLLKGRATATNPVYEADDPVAISRPAPKATNGNGGDTSKVINLDGIIDEGEWGAPILSISRDYAAAKSAGAQYSKNAYINKKTPSAENTFYYWNSTFDSTYDNGIDPDTGEALPKGKWSNGFKADSDFSYDVWMAWDYDYFYIAAYVNDPDTGIVSNNAGNIWNGDSFQFMVDADGPNSVMKDQGDVAYNPTQPHSFGYVKDFYTGDDASKDEITSDMPWGSAFKWPGTEWYTSGSVANIGAGYYATSNAARQYSVLYDMSPRYNPHLSQVVTQHDGQTDTTHDVIMWDKCDANVTTSTGNPLGLGYASVRPVIQEDGKTVKTTYEIAIPWSLIDGTKVGCERVWDEGLGQYTLVSNGLDLSNKKAIQAGAEFGLSLVVLNGARGQSGYNSWLGWGSGICTGQTGGEDALTAGGSNSMVLVDDELGTIGHVHTFGPAGCLEPAECTVPGCNYKRGYAAGHSYVTDSATPLYADRNGSVESICSRCGDTQTNTITAVEQSVYHELTQTARPLASDSEWNNSGWNHTYKVGEPQLTVGGVQDPTPTQIIFDENGYSKTPFVSLDGEMVFDLRDGIAGTYFNTNSTYGSFSYKYDFKLTTENEDEFKAAYGGDETDEARLEARLSPNTSYFPGIYHIFGGKYEAVDGSKTYGLYYAAGFFPNERGSNVGKFKIMQANTAVDKYSNFRVLAETDEITLGKDVWHSVDFVYDESAGIAMYYLDGECILAAWDPDMGMDGNTQESIIRIIDAPCIVRGNLALGSTTAFLDDAPASSGYTVTCDGVEYGPYDENEEVSLTVPAMGTVGDFAARFFTWEGATVARSEFNANNGTANGRTYTIVMPDEDVVLTPKYVVIGDASGDDYVTAQDVSAIKRILTDSSGSFPDEQMEGADINLDGFATANDLLLLKRLLTNAYTPVG